VAAKRTGREEGERGKGEGEGREKKNRA